MWYIVLKDLHTRIKYNNMEAMAAVYMPINDGCIVWTATETD